MTLEELSIQAQRQYHLYKSKSINPEEFKESMELIAIEINIAESSADLERDALCRSIISAISELATVAQLVSSFKY